MEGRNADVRFVSLGAPGTETVDAEGRVEYAEADPVDLRCGVHPGSVEEQRIAAQAGQQFDVVIRVPHGHGISPSRRDRVTVLSGPYVGAYDVVTVAPGRSCTRLLVRRYDVTAGV